MFVNKDGNIVILDDGVGGIEIPVEHLVQAIIVLSVGVLVIVTNVIIIATFITAPGTNTFSNVVQNMSPNISLNI